MSEEIKIESGIPIPPPKAGPSKGVSAALRAMTVGDSFVLPAKSRAGLCGTAARLRIKVATRKEGEDNIRVWRTE